MQQVAMERRNVIADEVDFARLRGPDERQDAIDFPFGPRGLAVAERDRTLRQPRRHIGTGGQRVERRAEFGGVRRHRLDEVDAERTDLHGRIGCEPTVHFATVRPVNPAAATQIAHKHMTADDLQESVDRFDIGGVKVDVARFVTADEREREIEQATGRRRPIFLLDQDFHRGVCPAGRRKSFGRRRIHVGRAPRLPSQNTASCDICFGQL